MISGTGFAIAKTMLLSFMVLMASTLNTPGAEQPMRTSAPLTASAKVPCLFSGLTLAMSSCCTRSLLPLSKRMPLEFRMVMFSGFTPSSRSRRAIAVPAAPAPFMTTFTSSIFLPTTSRAPRSAARAAIAVPCWSSWKTGMFMIFFSSSSMS
ncbi:Uncharacterised protein [Chlamydia trachomatis]|nr:Uncharacterised protein [Chlamydia trachomatis]